MLNLIKFSLLLVEDWLLRLEFQWKQRKLGSELNFNDAKCLNPSIFSLKCTMKNAHEKYTDFLGTVTVSLTNFNRSNRPCKNLLFFHLS